MAAADSGIKISVVIPAYNAARFLPLCLPSVFAQTYKPEEVIVVDDGSTDNTAEVAAELGARVIRRENGGISAARNTGIQNASCEWIALLDADDSWAPEKLERQAACIQPDTILVYTGVRFFDDNGSRGEHLAIDPARASKMMRYCAVNRTRKTRGHSPRWRFPRQYSRLRGLGAMGAATAAREV
jgi:glycosyltransferase involved in cell wall biosynthesis